MPDAENKLREAKKLYYSAVCDGDWKGAITLQQNALRNSTATSPQNIASARDSELV